MTDRRARSVILVAWDCADREILTPLLDAGRLPCLERLVDGGVMGRLECGPPLLSPLVPTTLATGVRADRHGILADEEPDPQTGGLRPVGSRSRRAPALWDRLDRRGLSAHVVGWPATDADEAIRGVVVAPRFARAEAPRDRPWPLPPVSVRPERVEEALALLRLHPGEVPTELLLAFVPGAARIDQSEDSRLADLAELLAEAVSLHAAATWVLEAEPCDFLAVHYPAIGRASRRFMAYHPPRRKGTSEADFALYRDVVAGVYELHDRMLGRLVDLAGPEATVLLVSGFGYHAGDERPRGPDGYMAGPAAAWHRSPGVFVAAGPSLRRDELIHGARVPDVAPTVLALFGLPLPAGLQGRPLIEAFTDCLVPTKDPAEGPWGGEAHRAAAHKDDEGGEEVQRALERLAALGYVDSPGEQERRMLHLNRLERESALAQVHLDAGRLDLAAELLEGLIAAEPRELAFVRALAACRLVLGWGGTSSALLEEAAARGRGGPRSNSLRVPLARAAARPRGPLAPTGGEGKP
jgi:hypothetical protein